MAKNVEKGTSLKLAKATVVCSIIFNEKDKTKISEKYKKRFMELHNSFSKSEEISALFGKYFKDK